MLAEGGAAPDFTLPDQDGGEVTLSELRGGTVVLYFYPRADTPGCTTQACGVRDRGADYAAAGARVIGISPDEVAAIDKFAGKHDLDFTLLADSDHAVADAYGTWVEKSMYGKKYMGVQRATFIVDPAGKIARVFPRSRRNSTTSWC
jgi:thioredoxin-dependent peroxiredoxin